MVRYYVVTIAAELALDCRMPCKVMVIVDRMLIVLMVAKVEVANSS